MISRVLSTSGKRGSGWRVLDPQLHVVKEMLTIAATRRGGRDRPVGTVHLTTVRTAKPLPHWATVPVTLMGDAIHTMVPQGTSAAVALHDAALLCRRITGRTGAVLDAVHAYETEMLQHGFAEVARSLRTIG